jgi:plastocyanin domain-containing protein
VIIYTDNSWPLWGRLLVTVVAVGILGALVWRYYRSYHR